MSGKRQYANEARQLTKAEKGVPVDVSTKKHEKKRQVIKIPQN